MQLIDVREDDLFLYTDGDELPRPEILQFFKLYDGWPQPVAFQYKWSIYGFFWQVEGKVYGAYSRPIPSMVSLYSCYYCRKTRWRVILEVSKLQSY